MNRIDLKAMLLFGEWRFFVNGMAVSRHVFNKACAQNNNIIKRRSELLSGEFVRPWNRIRAMDNAVRVDWFPLPERDLYKQRCEYVLPNNFNRLNCARLSNKRAAELARANGAGFTVEWKDGRREKYNADGMWLETEYPPFETAEPFLREMGFVR